MLRIKGGCEAIARHAAACMTIGDDAVRILVRHDEPLKANKLAEALKVPPANAIDVLHSDYRFRSALQLDTLVQLLTGTVSSEIRQASVAATLSRETHLFAAWGRAVWGLREWAGDWTDFVDLQLLAWRIDDEDLVFRVLEEGAKPLTRQQIVREIAQRFKLRVRRVAEVTLPIREDPRLTHDERTGLISLTAWLKRSCPLLLDSVGFLKQHASTRRRVSDWFASTWEMSLEDTLREYDIRLVQEGVIDEHFAESNRDC
jgi:hypothetical protein